MVRIEIGKHLVTDSRVCGGRLIFKGSRIPVSDVLELMEADYSAEAIISQYHNLLTEDAIHEAITFFKQGLLRETPLDIRTAA